MTAPAAPSPARPERVRVAVVQYQQQRVASFAEVLAQIEYFVGCAADYRADFVVFPEMLLLQALSAAQCPLTPAEAVDTLTRHTPAFTAALRDLAVRHRVHVLGGSHPLRRPDGRVENVAHLALRDGTLHERAKIHPTPNERRWWGVEGGRSLRAVPTDCGPVGVLICYDAEFPELGRHLADQGVELVLVPFCTDDRPGYLRVRHCCQARAVENQLYLALAGNVGNLRGVVNLDVQYAESCILTPCDLSFPPDGVAARAAPGLEALVVADLRLDDLRAARAAGTVRNLADRRLDLYGVEWRGGD